MGGISVERMLEDSIELIEKFNDVKAEIFLAREAEVKDERGGAKRKKKVRKNLGKE
jgi:hypothetical protein